jgi:prepilin-type N-terminal cleavage/methylation domain-containing protein
MMDTELSRERGFTLVEALVVAVIMVILAAVSIPLYSGFVDGQRLDAVKSLAQTAAINANGMVRRGNTNPGVSAIAASMFLPDPNAYVISISTNTDSVIVVDNLHGSGSIRASAYFRN